MNNNKCSFAYFGIRRNNVHVVRFAAGLTNCEEVSAALYADGIVTVSQMFRLRDMLVSGQQELRAITDRHAAAQAC